MSRKPYPHSDAAFEYITAQTELHHPHTPWRYTISVWNAQLSQWHCSQPQPRQTTSERLSPAFAAEWNSHVVFWEECPKHQIWLFFSLDRLISVVKKCQRFLCWGPNKINYHVQNKSDFVFTGSLKSVGRRAEIWENNVFYLFDFCFYQSCCLRQGSVAGIWQTQIQPAVVNC